MTPRGWVKRLIFLASVVAVSPSYVIWRLKTLFLDKEAAFQGSSQSMSLLPGVAGNSLRSAFYFLTLRRSSPETTVSFGTIFSTTNCEIGRHVYIGAYCVLSDSVIGNDSMLGSNVHVISGKHAHGFEASETPMRLQKVSRQLIHIGANSWIGNGAIVMADVGSGCVVGAGSVVTKAIKDDAIAVGNPARVIRDRTEPVGIPALPPH